jgi:citronellol/citronellal dehydrogenase
MAFYQGKTYFITGASRGIGKAIALKLAAEGANIVVAAKSVTENPKLGGTIFSAAQEIEQAGGKALAVACDIRDEEQIMNAVAQAGQKFGSLDGLINNASAISLTNTEDTAPKRYDLMMDINVRGTFMVTKYCLPHLKKSKNPHILTLSPPLNLKPAWFSGHAAYTLSKYNMTLLAMAWAAEFKSFGIAVNSLWPMTTIATAAVQNLLGGAQLVRRSRKPDIIADAVHFILRQNAQNYSGQQLLDESVLAQAGITNLDSYAINPGQELQKDLFLD